jgi:hypothetical protein
MKKALLPALLVLALASACNKDDTVATPTVASTSVTGAMSGTNEAPTPVTTSATGNVTATYDKSAKILTYTITYSGLTPTAGHFHIAAPGAAGPIVLLFPYVSYSPIQGATLLTQAQEDALLAGNLYANLHTTANPSGEIRANLVAK